MITRARLIVLLARPAVIVLLAMFTAVGLAQAGRGQDPAALIPPLAVVFAFLLFSVACNDLADEAIDRVNLPGQRPLATGALSRREFGIIGITAGVVALGISAALGPAALVVTFAGMCVSAGYSLRPVRLADRGAVASMALPACYVAVPYLLGVLAAGAPALSRGTMFLLGGLYLGFIGRILLKDFRDVRGDVLFGKRTFLVRHGRVRTCVLSVCCWVGGTGVILAATRHLTLAFLLAEAGCLAAALALLRALARDRGARRDEFLISATAIAGRGMVLLLLAHLSMVSAGWGVIRYDAVIGLLGLLTIGQMVSMVRYGPQTHQMSFDPELALANRRPQSRTRSSNSGGETTWKSAPVPPRAMTGQSSESVVMRTRHRLALISSTTDQRPMRSRTTAAGASTRTSVS
jgi:4-hydroxybenzoate polyprenyltransferase